MKLQSAQRVAMQTIQALHHDCVEIEVAGSIRREMPIVKDVELVYISKTTSQQMDLFGSHIQTFFNVDTMLATMIDDEMITKDIAVKRWGPKYKRVVHCASGIVIELFRAEIDNWGYILALRTGPDKFNKLLVTKHAKGGALPPDIKLQGGHVWHVGRTNIPTKISTPNERGFFALLDLPFIPPQERTAEYLKRLIKERPVCQSLTASVLAQAGTGRQNR
jgi:DNA polymerase/3'-5' exonuclease PolX